MSCIAVSDNYLVVGKGLLIDCYDSLNHTFYTIPSKPGEDAKDCIADIIISSDNKYLASVTSHSKQLTVCALPLTGEVKTYTIHRSVSKIRFTVNNTQILVADKTGDVIVYNIGSEESGTKLLGHLSLLLDILQTNDGKHLITCDRDEKIRVSCFPNTYNIETYCLGHKEFVNHIEMLPHSKKYLLSSSGDGTVKCWDYMSGLLAYNINAYLDVDDAKLKENFTKMMDEEGVEVIALPIVHCAITALDEDCSLIALTIHSYNKIIIYSLETKNNQFIHKKEHILDIEKFPTDIKLHNQLLYLYDDEDLTVSIFTIVKNCKINLEFHKKIKMFEDHTVTCDPKSNIEAIKILYKRKFDNVQEYQERKRKRLEKISQ